MGGGLPYMKHSNIYCLLVVVSDRQSVVAIFSCPLSNKKLSLSSMLKCVCVCQRVIYMEQSILTMDRHNTHCFLHVN